MPEIRTEEEPQACILAKAEDTSFFRVQHREQLCSKNSLIYIPVQANGTQAIPSQGVWT